MSGQSQTSEYCRLVDCRCENVLVIWPLDSNGDLDVNVRFPTVKSTGIRTCLQAVLTTKWIPLGTKRSRLDRDIAKLLDEKKSFDTQKLHPHLPTNERLRTDLIAPCPSVPTAPSVASSSSASHSFAGMTNIPRPAPCASHVPSPPPPSPQCPLPHATPSLAVHSC